MNENPTLRLRRLLLILAAGGTVRDEVLQQAEREAQLSNAGMDTFFQVSDPEDQRTTA